MHAEYQLALARGSQIPKKPRSKKGGSIGVLVFVYMYLSMGVVYFLVSNYFNMVKIFS